MNFIKDIKRKVKDSNQKPRILFTEGWNLTIQKVAIYLKKENNIIPILLLRDNKDINSNIENIEKFVISENNLDEYANYLFELRKSKGLTLEEAKKLVSMPNYLTSLLVKLDKYDGGICGIEYPTKDTLKPALQIIKLANGYDIVNSLMVLWKKNNLLLFSDIGMVVDPNHQEIAFITENTIKFAQNILEWKNNNVALLSFSSNGSGKGESVNKVKEAYSFIKERNNFPNENIFGEIQFDAASIEMIRLKKIPSLDWKQNANVYIFPNLDAGNISYKIMQRFAGFSVVGPIVVGLNKPINDLSRGATFEEIISLSYITALQYLKGKNN